MSKHCQWHCNSSAGKPILFGEVESCRQQMGSKLVACLSDKGVLSPKLQAGLRAFADVGGMEPLARTSECGWAKPAGGLPFMFYSMAM